MADLFDEKNISPMLLNEVKGPFVGDDYIYELKAILSKAVTEGYNLSVTRWIEKNGVVFFELAKKKKTESGGMRQPVWKGLRDDK